MTADDALVGAVPLPRRVVGVVAGLSLIAVLAAIDLNLGTRETVIGIVVIAPFVTAMLAAVRDTAMVGAVAVAVAALSAIWNDDASSVAYWIQLSGGISGAVFAVLGAQARVRDEVARRRLELLAAVAEVADGQLALQATVERIVALLAPAFADMAIVDAMQHGAYARLAARVSGPDGDAAEERIAARHPLGGEAERALRDGESRLLGVTEETLTSTAHDAEDLALLRSLDMVSYLVVPLKARGRTLGTLTLVDRAHSKRRFAADDLRFTEVLSGRVALALDNAGLFSELESMEAQLTAALGSLSDAVTVQNSEGRLVFVNEAAARTIGFVDVPTMLATPPEAILAQYDVTTEDGRPVDLADLPGRRVLDGLPARPLTVRSVHRVTGEERWQLIKASPVPDREGRPHLAVNVIEDITDVKRAEFGQRLLVDAGAVLAGSLDVELTLQQVAELAVPELADWCAAGLPDADGRLRQVAVAHPDPLKVRFAHEYQRRYPVHVDDPGGAAEVLRTGRSWLIPLIPEAAVDAAIADPAQRASVKAIAPRSLMVVPITAGGDPLGVLTFVTAESTRTFSDADLALAEELGRRAGTAVQNARMYAERTHIARTLQTGLLPDAVPDIPGLSIATLYRPAGEENWVGGDFYDAFAVGDGWMVVVGDVAGRGPAAAALTALARYTLRTAAMLGGCPTQALEHLNRELMSRPGTWLVTAAVAFFRPAARGMTLRVASAGHPPALLVRGGVVRPVGHFGPLLGAFADASWDPVDFDLDDGDLLVLYTDGVIDTRGEEGRFGEAALHDTVRPAVDAADAVHRIERALEAFEAGDQADDTAVVAIRAGQAPLPATRHRLELPGGIHAPARARHVVEEWVGDGLPPASLYDLQVLVSELVTNAVRHAGAGEEQTIVLEAEVSPARVRVAVTDPGPGFVPEHPPRQRAVGGAGLVLVDRLSSRWAVDPGPPSVVWFELEPAGDRAPAAV